MAAACTIALAGCAGVPRGSHAPATEEDKSAFAAADSAELDGDARDNFEAALRHLTAGQFEKGIELLNKVTQRAPRQMAPHINLAIAYQKIGKLNAAEESIKKAVALSPDHPVANTEYGLIYRRTGRFVEARRTYERVLERYPGFLPARKNLGILCDVYLRDFDCALTHYRLYGDAAPDEKNVRIWIADIERRLGQPQQ